MADSLDQISANGEAICPNSDDDSVMYVAATS